MLFSSMRPLHTLCLLLFLSGILFTPRNAGAQPASTAPAALSGIAKRLASGKIPAGSTAASEGTRFTPSGKRIYVAKMVDTLTEDEDQKKALTDLFEKALITFDTAIKKAGMANDMAPALALYIQTLWSVQSGKEVPDAGSDKLIVQMRGLLNSPEIAGLSNSDKQSLYEYCVCMSTMTLTLYQAAEGKEEQLNSVRTFARSALKTLLGVEADKVAISTKGLEISGAVANVEDSPTTSAGSATTPPPGNLPKVTYTIPPDSRVEQRGAITLIYRPKYDGYTKNPFEELYYSVPPPVKASSQPNREAAFESDWNAYTKGLKVTWQERTLVYRYYLPSGAVCYVAMARQRNLKDGGGYRSHDGVEMLMCMLDFGTYYVTVAEVYQWKDGYDNLSYLAPAFDNFIASIRIPGASTPQNYLTKDQLIGAWTHTGGSYSSTDYYNSTTGAYAGNVTNASSSRESFTLRTNGTVKYEFVWWFNGKIQTDIWDGTWTYQQGRLVLKNPKTGKAREYTAVFNGKHPKTGERFIAFHVLYSKEKPLSPYNVNADDTKLYVPLKPK